MTHSIYWPGTAVVKSQGNAFTAHERGATTIDWGKEPDFRTTVKQREQRIRALEQGRQSIDPAYKRRGVDLAPRIHSNICKPRGR